MENLSRREREKLARKEEIINAAENLFYEDGYDNVSMDQIAKKAEFTKRTIYQYFTSKEDLFFAVAHRGFVKMFSYFQKASQKGKTAFEKLHLACLAYYQFYKDCPETFRLMNYIGYVKKNNSPQQKEWMEFDNRMFEQIARIVKDGKKDGSIREDLDSDMVTFSIAFITTGFFKQLSETGNTFTEHFDLDIEKFSNYSIDLILESIRRK